MKTNEIKNKLIQQIGARESQKSKAQETKEFAKLLQDIVGSKESSGEKITNVGKASNINSIGTVPAIVEQDEKMNYQEVFPTLESFINQLDQFSSELNKTNPDTQKIGNLLEPIFQTTLDEKVPQPIKDLWEEIKITAYTEYIKWKRGDFF